MMLVDMKHIDRAVYAKFYSISIMGATALGLSRMQGMYTVSNGRKSLLNIVPLEHLRLGPRLGSPAPLDSGFDDRAGEDAQDELAPASEPDVALDAESYLGRLWLSSISVACEQPSGILVP